MAQYEIKLAGKWFPVEAESWADAAISAMLPPGAEDMATIEVRRGPEVNRFVVTREVVYNARLVRD